MILNLAQNFPQNSQCESKIKGNHPKNQTQLMLNRFKLLFYCLVCFFLSRISCYIKFTAHRVIITTFTSPLLKKTLTHAISERILSITDANSSVGIDTSKLYWRASANLGVFFRPQHRQHFMADCIGQLLSWRFPVSRSVNPVQSATLLIDTNGGRFFNLLETIMSKNQLKAAGISAHTYQTYQLICYHLCGVALATLAMLGGRL